MIETYPAKAVEIYKEYLHEIVGIKFTFREVDVIACILHNRGEKKIGSLLAISYRTVGTHIRHIMGKISGNSRDDLIDFIEKSGKLRYIHEYYYHLTIESLFNAKLRKIGALVNHSEAYCSLSISNITDKERVLLESIIESLKLARIYLIQENVISKKIQCNIYTFSETFRVEKDKTNISESIVIVLDQKSDISLFKDLGYINFRDYTKYYSTILELIESILKGAEVIKIIEEFNTEFKALKYSLKNDTIVTKEFVQRNSLRVRYSILSLILLVIVSTSVIYIYYLHYNNSTIHKKEASIVKLETFNIPHYLEYYIDRKELTKTIWDRFDGRGTERRTSVLVGLHGLGGIGKSTLAKNAIHNPQQQYTFKGWFNAETKDLLEHDYFQLGEKYHLFSKNMAEHQKITRVIDWIEQHGKTLLVYDNVPDLEMLEKYLPNKGHIIITSRNYKIPGAIEVDVMTEQESIQLVENLLLDTVKKSENYKFEIDQLVKELGYLPLALSHAGAYIAENALTIGGYLSLYSTEKDKLLSNNIAPAMDKHGSIYVTWDISLEKIRQQPEAKNVFYLLQFIAYCYPENIPKKLLAQYLFDKTDNDAMVKLNKTLTLLKKYSLIKISQNTLSIHRLVHTWLNSKLSQEDKLKLLKKVKKTIENIYKTEVREDDNHDLIKILLPQIEFFLSHIKRHQKQIEFLELAQYTADIYYKLGDYYKAKEILEKALKINKQYLSHDRNRILFSNIIQLLGKVEMSLGNYDKAKNLLEETLRIQKNNCINHQDVEIVSTLQFLGRVNLWLGNYDEAKNLLIKALEIQQDYYGTRKHIKTAFTLQSLGRTYLELGDYIIARSLLTEALEIQKQYYYNKEHAHIALSLRYLGKAHIKLGDYYKAKTILEEALEIQKQYYKISNHIEIAFTLRYIGKVYFKLGNYYKAKTILEESLTIHENHYRTRKHITVTFVLRYLARVYLELKDYTKTKSLLEEALEIQRSCISTSKDILLAFILKYLGVLHLKLGNYIEAKNLLEQVLKIQESYYGTRKHIDVAFTFKDLGIVYTKLKYYKETKQLLEQALAVQENYYGLKHLEVATTLIALVQLESDLGNHKKALYHLERASNIIIHHNPKLHPNYSVIQEIRNLKANLQKFTNLPFLDYVFLN